MTATAQPGRAQQARVKHNGTASGVSGESINEEFTRDAIESPCEGDLSARGPAALVSRRRSEETRSGPTPRRARYGGTDVVIGVTLQACAQFAHDAVDPRVEPGARLYPEAPGPFVVLVRGDRQGSAGPGPGPGPVGAVAGEIGGVSYTATSSSALVAHLNNKLKLSQAEPEKPAYLPRSSTSSSNDMLVRRHPPGAKAKLT